MLVFLALIGCHASISTTPVGADPVGAEARQQPLDAAFAINALLNIAVVRGLIPEGDQHYIGFGRVEQGHECRHFLEKFDGSSVARIPGAQCPAVAYDGNLNACDGNEAVEYAIVACPRESGGVRNGSGIELLIVAQP